MTTDSTTTADDGTLFLGEAWSDPIEAGIRDRIRGFIEELIEEELAAALGRGRYQRRQRRGEGEAGSADGRPAAATGDVPPRDGHRHGHRQRRITGSFGTVEIAVPRARIGGAGGPGREWKSKALPRYARMTRQVEALIAGTYLAGTYLAGTYLAGTYLAGTYLAGTYLAGTYLAGTYLAGTYLAGTYLAGTYLAGTYLAGTYLAGTYLAGTYLAGTYLAGTYLAGTYLAGTYLAGTYLAGTYLAGTYLAGTYLAGTNTRRVRRALAALFKGAIGKDTVSRIWRKVKTDWEAWAKRPLAAEDVVRLILDGTVVRVRLDKKATSISLLVVLGVRRDGQKVLLAVKNMGGESEAAWRALLDDLVARGLKTPEFLIVDGAAGLEKALAALWPEVPTQRCTVHKHRNLLAHAPDQLHEEISADYTDMIYAATPKEVEERRRAFIRKWRLKCRAVADSLEEAGARLFTFTRLPPGQWRSARTSNAVERLHEEFKRRIKTQTVLPSPETAAMLFWALLASGQITMRKVDGWQTLATKPTDAVIDLAA